MVIYSACFAFFTQCTFTKIARRACMIAMLFLTLIATAREYHDLELGETAYNSGDYRQAAKFYRQYWSEALKKNDDQALANAGLRLIATAIRNADAVEAENVLTEFENRFPLAETIKTTLFKADILMLKGEPEKAESLLKDVLRQPITGTLYFQLLSSLGYSLILQRHWDDATNYYDLLLKAAAGTRWEFVGFRQKLYAMIMDGQLQQSRKLLEQSNKYNNHPDAFDLELLLLLQMVREKKFSELKKKYDEIAGKILLQPNALLFEINQLAASHYLNNDRPGDAVFFLKEAFKFALKESERRIGLQRVIDTCVTANMPEEAIAAALKYIEFYSRDVTTIPVRFQCARLMNQNGMPKDALAVYNALLLLPDLEPSQAVAAAREAAAINERLEQYEEASRMYQTMFDRGTTPDEKLEGKFLYGESLYRRGQYLRAVEVFTETAKEASKWRDWARFRKLQALLRLEKYQQSFLLATELCAVDSPENIVADSHYYRAYTLQQLGRDAEAIAAYLEFMSKYPENRFVANALFDTGNLYFEMSEYEKAVLNFLQFVEEFPANEFAANALYKCVYAYYFLDKPDDAAATITRLIEKYPGSVYAPAAQLRQVDDLRLQGKYQEAASVLESMLEKYGENAEVMPKILYDRAQAYAHMQETKNALQLIEKLIAKYSGSSPATDALFLAGNITSENSNYQDAVNYYRQAAKLRPA